MKKRFYDQDVNVSNAVEMFLLFPETLQEIIAEGLAQIAEIEYQANEALKDIRSLGTERVLALYKSKQKKRKYDQNPTVHKAMNYLMVISPENRHFLANRIIELMGYIQDYLKTCQMYTTSPEADKVQVLTDLYVQLGSDECRKFLTSVQTEFKRKLDGKPLLEDDVKEAPAIGEAIQDQGLGMRIRGGIRKD